MLVIVCDDLGEGFENVEDMVGVVYIRLIIGIVTMLLLLLFVSLLFSLPLLIFKVFRSCRAVLQTMRSRCFVERDRRIREVRKCFLHVILLLNFECRDHILYVSLLIGNFFFLLLEFA